LVNPTLGVSYSCGWSFVRCDFQQTQVARELKANENENDRKNRRTVGGLFVGSMIKARNNLLAVWCC
jgi:hypothetical protein